MNNNRSSSVGLPVGGYRSIMKVVINIDFHPPQEWSGDWVPPEVPKTTTLEVFQEYWKDAGQRIEQLFEEKDAELRNK